MAKIKIVTPESVRIIDSHPSHSLKDILRKANFNIYSPCGGKGTCGKCLVSVKDEGEVLSCKYYPDKDIEVNLPHQED